MRRRFRIRWNWRLDNRIQYPADALMINKGSGFDWKVFVGTMKKQEVQSGTLYVPGAMYPSAHVGPQDPSKGP